MNSSSSCVYMDVDDMCVAGVCVEDGCVEGVSVSSGCVCLWRVCLCVEGVWMCLCVCVCRVLSVWRVLRCGGVEVCVVRTRMAVICCVMHHSWNHTIQCIYV